MKRIIALTLPEWGTGLLKKKMILSDSVLSWDEELVCVEKKNNLFLVEHGKCSEIHFV